MRFLDMLERRFEARVIRGDDCWEWQGAHNDHGYGQMFYGSRRMVYAHRYAYERFVGPIPDRYVIDHLCRNPGCCNPEHLQAVTHQENIRRGRAGTKRACNYGHDWNNPKNVYVRKNGRRFCAECARQKARA